MIFRCQSGFETFLEKELSGSGILTSDRGEGWLLATAPNDKVDLSGYCFAHEVFLAPVELRGESVNALAAGIADYFLATARTEKFTAPWPLLYATAGGMDGLGRRADTVMKALWDVLKKKVSRVAGLAMDERPRGMGRARGLHVYFADFGRVYVSRECVFGGQRRMADDELAPSRSYLKLEEAYVVLGRDPALDDSVADLGAAPGGWSYSAAKRGARVVAVDNGPLKGGALGHPLIDHRCEDAFRFQPGQGERFDWMLCDLVEDPHHVMSNIIEPWIVHGWCRRFVANLKFGRVDPVALLKEITAPGSVLATKVSGLRIRHLYHDREEFTLVGEVIR